MTPSSISRPRVCASNLGGEEIRWRSECGDRVDRAAGRTVEYAAPPGYRPLLLDLYTPRETPAPVVLFLHGGGWRLGTRSVFCPTWRGWRPDPFQRLSAAGFAVASVDYRLSGEGVFPTQLHDVTAALRWLRTRGDELGVDADRVVAWGESAGGHLAALLGLTANRTGLAELEAPELASRASP